MTVPTFIQATAIKQWVINTGRVHAVTMKALANSRIGITDSNRDEYDIDTIL